MVGHTTLARGGTCRLAQARSVVAPAVGPNGQLKVRQREKVRGLKRRREGGREIVLER